MVIPPLAAEKIGLGTTIIENLCYIYKYDERNRLIEKKLPGKGKEYMVYDKQDRLVATQDANLRADNKWLFTKYDKFGRVVYTGMMNSSVSREALQTTVNGFGSNNEERKSTVQFSQNGTSVYYTKNAFPTSFSDVLSVNYYDTYEGQAPDLQQLFEHAPLSDANGQLKGLPVSSFVRVIGTTGWEKAYTAYDDLSRAYGSYKINHLGGFTQTKSELNFKGLPTKTTTAHKSTNNGIQVNVEETFVYDQMLRLLSHHHSINGQTPQLIAKNEYDPLGQLVSKKVGGNQNGSDRWQEVDYRYNIRGWLTDINDINQLQKTGQPVDLFAFRINYNNPVAGDFQTAGLDVQPLFNGNIAETYWRSASDNTLRGYGYSYDELNRLKNAYYRKPNTVTPLPQTFDEYLAYDLNGNITGLQRYSGNDTPGSAQLTDELDYSYFTNSNRLREVTDNQNSSIGFDDGNTSGDDYEYDLNGNMTKDKNKGITSIAYNHLNLPVEIIWSSTKKIEYLYNAAGVKVQKKVTNGVNIKTTDYLDGFQYNQQLLEFFPHPEGYVKATNLSLGGNPNYVFNYVYNYTDHLGNVRVSYTKDPQTGNLKILDESHYYPFGLKHQEYSTFGFVNNPIQGVVIAPLINNPYKYKYNGKEWQDELGFGFYTFGFRDYMPDIGRFATIDPMADFVNHQSPYVMANNNPVIYEDVYGLGIINAIGNLVKRAVNGLKSLVPRSMRGCSCNTETKESLGDAFRRPDFPGSGRSSGGGSPNRSSSQSSTPSKGNNKVVSTIDIPKAGLDLNEFSPEISMNINLPDLDNFFPKPTGVENSAIFSRTPPRVGDTYSIPITFNSSTTSIRNTSLNEKALNDLLKVMQNDPKLNLLILGNVVFNPPLQNNNQTIVNGSVGTVGDLKIGRARAVEYFLIERGINPKRIKVGYGNVSTDNTSENNYSTTVIFK